MSLNYSLVMTSPQQQGPSFVLFSNGSHYSCCVLNELIQRNCRPRMIVVPGYAPSKSFESTNKIFSAIPIQNPLIDIADGIPFCHMPKEHQLNIVPKLKKICPDYLLVACWPYRIDAKIAAFANQAALNLHPSLLPSYPGPDPVKAQIENRETCLGVTLHKLSQQLDQGEIVAQTGIECKDKKKERLVIEKRCADAGVDQFIVAVKKFEQE